jgi:pyruvate,water dikinase
MTDVLVNVASPCSARQAATLPVQGVGLMRAEFLFYSLGQHPRFMMEAGTPGKLVDTLSIGIREVAAAFYPRRVLYRALDFKSNEMRSLVGGTEYEPLEDNPALGLRGCSRYEHDPEVFALELTALAQARATGLDNVHLIVPFVRYPHELERCRKQMAVAGLDNGAVELWAMAEVPASFFLLAEFTPFIQGVSIGTNDLTQLLFGVDRDNPHIAHLFDDGHPVVVHVACSMVTTARALGLRTSVCGDRVSRDAHFVRKLVTAGVDSLSVSPEAVTATLAHVAAAQGNLEAS